MTYCAKIGFDLMIWKCGDLKIEAITMNDEIIDIENFSKGIYFVKPETVKSGSVKKLIVQ